LQRHIFRRKSQHAPLFDSSQTENPKFVPSSTVDLGFNARLSGCTDGAISSTLGESSKQAIYHPVGQRFNLNQEQLKVKAVELLNNLKRYLVKAALTEES